MQDQEPEAAEIPTIQQTASKYCKLEKVAEGTYGVVYKGKNLHTNQLVAIKKFKTFNKQGIPTSFIRELSVINLMQHSSHALKLYDTILKKSSPMMVMQWLDHNLKSLIQNKAPINLKLMTYQIVLAIHDFHEEYIIHRDLKPSNIMVLNPLNSKEPMLVKIIDYGMSRERMVDGSLTYQVGSLYYRAPELLMEHKLYSFQVDIWAFGCIFYQLFTGRILFKTSDELAQLQRIFSFTGTPSPENHPFIHTLFSETFAIGTAVPKKYFPEAYEEFAARQPNKEAWDLLQSCLSLEPQKRPSTTQILTHSYFKDLAH